MNLIKNPKNCQFYSLVDVLNALDMLLKRSVEVSSKENCITDLYETPTEAFKSSTKK